MLPGRTVTIRDRGPYGLIMLQGHGTMGAWPVETPAMIRFGQLTNDEYFVSAKAAQEGVTHHQPERERSAGHAQALRARPRRSARLTQGGQPRSKQSRPG